MSCRRAIAFVLCALIVWVPLSVLSQNGSSLTLEEEWSNAMYYTDRHVLSGIAATSGGLMGVGIGTLWMVAGIGLLFPLGSEGLIPSVLGGGMCVLGAGSGIGGLLFTLYAGAGTAMFLSQRSELIAIGRDQGWLRRAEFLHASDPSARALVKASDAPYDWVELFRRLTSP